MIGQTVFTFKPFKVQSLTPVVYISLFKKYDDKLDTMNAVNLQQ